MDWLHETYKWLLQNFPNNPTIENIKLVTPNKECFPHLSESVEERVSEIFTNVRRLSGMEDWPCVLQVQEEDPDPHVAPTVLIENAPQGPSGTFRLDEQNRAVISFNINLVNDNWALVSTFAHELAHYLTCSTKEPPPGGWENWEFATDLAAVYLGFGIFLSNMAFNYQQFVDMQSQTQGWSTRRQGYLSENELLYGLAIFVLINNMDEKKPLRYLKDSLKGRYKKSLKYIKDTDIINELCSAKDETLRNMA
jgi:hypothetical protein